MVRNIVKDIFFLGQKSATATKADAHIIQDLTDTLRANSEACVGMAANMIGEKKCIIVVSIGMCILPMVNPVIVEKSGKYQTEEGCLSLTGVRKTVRYEMIQVEYADKDFVKKRERFSGWTAQIIQHEIDHCNGIVI